MMTSEKWQMTSGFELLWHTWDDESVVYHTGSGDTHLLDTIAMSALMALENKALTVAELVEKVSKHCAINPDPAFFESITQLISSFNRLGLIERYSH